MQIVYLNGRRLQLTWREAQAQFRHPLFVGMILVLAMCIIAIGPYDHLLNFGALRLAIFYAVCFSSFTASFYLALYLCHRFNWRAYSLFTVTFGCLGATLCGLSAALLLGAPMPSARDMALVTGFNLAFCYLGEVLQSTFIIPRVLADLRGRPQRALLAEFIASEAGALEHDPAAAASDTEMPATKERPPEPPCPSEPPHLSEAPAPVVSQRVILFGQTFATSSICLIEAEEHYVAVVLHDGTRHLLRGRIADAVAAMPPELGQRVHRSYWVATSAVAGFRPDKPGAQLLLSTGQSLPVARPRLATIRSWAEAAAGAAAGAGRGAGTGRPVRPAAVKGEKKKAPQRVPPASS